MNAKSYLLIFIVFIFCQSFQIANSNTITEIVNRGIEEYKQENYEEAIELLKKANEQNLKSSLSAFFLGMAYKQTSNYPKALVHLREAVTIEPPIKEALIELIDTLINLSDMNYLDEAQKWINNAEKEKIFPGQTAFLKGLFYHKKNEFELAIESFNNAKLKDTSLIQSSDFQIALCLLKLQELNKAKNVFKIASMYNPKTEIAEFARNYEDAIDKKLFFERPLKFTAGIFGQYDTNMLLKPNDDTAASGVTDEKSLAILLNFRANWIPKIEGPFIFSLEYNGSFNPHQKNSTTHDLISNSISIQPGYLTDKMSFNFFAKYNHYLLRDKEYKGYLGQVSAGPLMRFFFIQSHLIELFAGYDSKEYFQDFLSEEEDRNSNAWNTYINWIWQFNSSLFINPKYEYILEKTDGANWDNTGHKFTINSVFYILNNIQLQLSIDEFIQNYKNVHTVFNEKRWDHINTASIGILWDASKNLNLIFQYSRIRCNSNIGLYDYNRSLYSLGVELKF
ncbi:MAG: DUF2860 family protein [Desulfobacterales bacterium]|nr:DUF2860 family protein [Desulfobacterales bacterium]